MSIKSKLVTAATTLTVIAGVGAAGTLTANAATPKCGAICSDFYSHASGTGYVLDTPNQAAQVGRSLTLAKATGTSKGEDFGINALGTLSDFYNAGLVSKGLNTLYGSQNVYEIQYAPGGSPSNLCLGTAGTPATGTPVTLQPCGATAKTIWIFVPEKVGNSTYNELISAATTNGNAQHPDALTTVSPGTALFTTSLVASTSSSYSHQLWAYEQGVLPN